MVFDGPAPNIAKIERLSSGIPDDWQLAVTYQKSNAATGGWCSPMYNALAEIGNSTVGSYGQATTPLDGTKKCTYIINAAVGMAPGFSLDNSTTYFDYDLHYIEYRDDEADYLTIAGLTSYPDPLGAANAFAEDGSQQLNWIPTRYPPGMKGWIKVPT